MNFPFHFKDLFIKMKKKKLLLSKPKGKRIFLVFVLWAGTKMLRYIVYWKVSTWYIMEIYQREEILVNITKILPIYRLEGINRRFFSLIGCHRKNRRYFSNLSSIFWWYIFFFFGGGGGEHLPSTPNCLP